MHFPLIVCLFRYVCDRNVLILFERSNTIYIRVTKWQTDMHSLIRTFIALTADNENIITIEQMVPIWLQVPFYIYYSSVDCMCIIINNIVTDYYCVIASELCENVYMHVQSVMWRTMHYYIGWQIDLFSVNVHSISF